MNLWKWDFVTVYPGYESVKSNKLAWIAKKICHVEKMKVKNFEDVHPVVGIGEIWFNVDSSSSSSFELFFVDSIGIILLTFDEITALRVNEELDTLVFFISSKIKKCNLIKRFTFLTMKTFIYWNINSFMGTNNNSRIKTNDFTYLSCKFCANFAKKIAKVNLTSLILH